MTSLLLPRFITNWPNINKIIDNWYPIAEKHNADGKFRLVIIDDGSYDDALHNQEPQLFATLAGGPDESNGGYRDTVLYGYRYAISKDID